MFLPDWCCVRCGCLGCGLSLAPAPASQCEDRQYSNMLIGSNLRGDVIRYLTLTSNEKRLEGSKRCTEHFGECMESARVCCVVYDQVCGVITGYFATVATAQPLTTALATPDNSTWWALHTNNMLLTGAHRYPAHHSARQEMNSFLWRDPRKMKISDNGKISMWIESRHLCCERLARRMTWAISQLTTDVRYFVLHIFCILQAN